MSTANFKLLNKSLKLYNLKKNKRKIIILKEIPKKWMKIKFKQKIDLKHSCNTQEITRH